MNIVFGNLGLQACGNCRGRSGVRSNVALTLSKRRSLFAPPTIQQPSYSFAEKFTLSQ